YDQMHLFICKCNIAMFGLQALLKLFSINMTNVIKPNKIQKMDDQNSKYQTFLNVGSRLMMDQTGISLEELKTALEVLEAETAKINSNLERYELQTELYPNTTSGMRNDIIFIEHLSLQCREIIASLENG